MNKRFILFSLGIILEILAAILIVPAFIAFYELPASPLIQKCISPDFLGFVIAIVSSFASGKLLKALGTNTLIGTGIKEGFAIVTFGWLLSSFFGAIPLFTYFLSVSQQIDISSIALAFTDSYFEIMSGFTTTGSTILTNIEALPKGILFWRSLTHWLGGMGIVTLVLAILPAFGIASYQMFRGEIPGPTTERLKPRLSQTAKILWGAYALLTFVETVLLRIGGMPWFDAWCHSFGTLATGGFSTQNASIANYSPYIQWVIIIFMFLAGMNFIIHYRIIFAGDFEFPKRDKEFHFYSIVLLIAILASTFILQSKGLASEKQIKSSFRPQAMSEELYAEKVDTEKSKIDSFESTLRHSAFQVISITTTTGYGTADFDMWPNFLRLMLVVLMFFGGCAGSTGGGIKMVRIMVILQTAWREVKTLVQPRLISRIKISDAAMDERQVSNIMGFVTLFLTAFAIFSLIMCFYIEDVTTAVTSVVATMCNIGPGLSGVGSTENFSWIPLGGKWVLTFCMLLGRLEIYTVFIALSSLGWKK